MRYIIDRIEHNVVICETEEKTMKEFPLELFSECPKSGDIVEYHNGTITVCKEETQARHDEIRSLFDRLKKR